MKSQDHARGAERLERRNSVTNGALAGKSCHQTLTPKSCVMTVHLVRNAVFRMIFHDFSFVVEHFRCVEVAVAFRTSNFAVM